MFEGVLSVAATARVDAPRSREERGPSTPEPGWQRLRRRQLVLRGVFLAYLPGIGALSGLVGARGQIVMLAAWSVALVVALVRLRDVACPACGGPFTRAATDSGEVAARDLLTRCCLTCGASAPKPGAIPPGHPTANEQGGRR
jgi:hypothetical protein